MKRVGSINNLKRDASSTTSSNEVSTTTSHTINTITHKNINESIKNDIINKNNNNLTAHQQQQQQQQLTATNQNNNNFNHQFALSQWITQTFVATAIKIKQSPLPEIVTMTTDLSLETYKKLDSLIGINNHIIRWSQAAVKQSVVATGYLAAASIKAGIAYQRTPGYLDQQQNSNHSSQTNQKIITRRLLTEVPGEYPVLGDLVDKSTQTFTEEPVKGLKKKKSVSDYMYQAAQNAHSYGVGCMKPSSTSVSASINSSSSSTSASVHASGITETLSNTFINSLTSSCTSTFNQLPASIKEEEDEEKVGNKEDKVETRDHKYRNEGKRMSARHNFITTFYALNPSIKSPTSHTILNPSAQPSYEYENHQKSTTLNTQRMYTSTSTQFNADMGGASSVALSASSLPSHLSPPNSPNNLVPHPLNQIHLVVGGLQYSFNKQILDNHPFSNINHYFIKSKKNAFSKRCKRMKEREEYVLDYCGVSFYYVLEFLRDEESGKQLIQVIRDQVLLKSISLMAEISGLVDLSDAIEIRLHRIDLERTLGWVYGLTVGLMGIVKVFIELVCRIFVFEVRNEVSDVSSELRAESNCKGSKRSKEMNDTEIDPRDESKSNLDTQNRNLVKSLNKNVDRILGMESVHFLVSFTLLAVFGWILTQVFLA